MRKFTAITSSVLISIFTLTSCGSAKVADSTNHTHSTATPKTGTGEAAQGGGTYLNEPIPAEVLNLPLVDQYGTSLTLDSLKGKTVVITNFLTSCQEICPMTSANMRDVGDAVAKGKASNKIKVLEISVDSKRDVPSRLLAYQNLFATKNWTLASGSATNLAKLWDFFGAPATMEEFSDSAKKSNPPDWQTGKPVSYDMMHADLVLIIDGKSTWRWLDLGAPNVGSIGIPEKLKSYLTPDGLRNLEKPDGSSWKVDAIYSALVDITGIHLAN
jgi:protein SCO1/2